MKQVHKAWLDKRTNKARDGKPNQVENEFRQRFKLKDKKAHEIIKEWFTLYSTPII